MRTSTVSCILMAGMAALVPGQVSARKPKDAWAVSRLQDPITGVSSCVVTAPDQFGKFKFSRFSYLYPVVENNSQLGLLVGVSSGGQYRVPTGDILWRVDSNPFRQLKAADNPAGMPSIAPTAPSPTGNAQVDKSIADAMANASRLTAAFTSTSTVARGAKAAEMLREMLGGHSLLYRQAGAAPTFGLPSSKTYAVGQWTGDALRPIPLDDSFRRGLAACGIAPPPPASE